MSGACAEEPLRNSNHLKVRADSEQMRLFCLALQRFRAGTERFPETHKGLAAEGDPRCPKAGRDAEAAIAKSCPAPR
jgi:hypothetical protein